MLNLDTDILDTVIEQAKQSAAGHQRWINAIEKAAREMVENPYIEALDNHTLLIGSSNGKTYTGNGVCQCEAFNHGKPCYHRAAARLYHRYLQATRADGTK
jgi:hypothetical protein